MLILSTGVYAETPISPTDAGVIMREAMKQRKSLESVLVEVRKDLDIDKYGEDIIRITMDGAMQDVKKETLTHTGKGNEGDYLKYSLKKAGNKAELYDFEDNYMQFTDSLYFEYYDDAEKEAKTTAACKKILSKLALNGKTDYQKVEAIYNWITKNVRFDNKAEAVGGEDKYPWAYSAYGAAVLKKSTCQGFALLMYRLCNDAGVECRIVCGRAKSGGTWKDHAWNIVRIGNFYYQCDPTWDATQRHNGKKYAYFMEADLSDHEMDKEDRKSYTFAKSRYVPKYKLTVIGGKGSGIYAKDTKRPIKATVIKGKKFVKWISNGAPLSRVAASKRASKIKMTTDTTVTAVTQYIPIKKLKGKHRIKLYGGKYLTIKNNSKASGATTAAGGKTSVSAVFNFKKTGTKYYIQNVHSGKYLKANGNTIIQVPKSNATKWTIVSAGNRKYRLISGTDAVKAGTKMATDEDTKSQQVSIS